MCHFSTNESNTWRSPSPKQGSQPKAMQRKLQPQPLANTSGGGRHSDSPCRRQEEHHSSKVAMCHVPWWKFWQCRHSFLPTGGPDPVPLSRADGAMLMGCAPAVGGSSQVRGTFVTLRTRLLQGWKVGQDCPPPPRTRWLSNSEKLATKAREGMLDALGASPSPVLPFRPQVRRASEAARIARCRRPPSLAPAQPYLVKTSG